VSSQKEALVLKDYNSMVVLIQTLPSYCDRNLSSDSSDSSDSRELEMK
jgi:hypothetical protein